jgi:hypothetical protein
MNIDLGDPFVLGATAGGVLIVAVIATLPAVLRVIRIRWLQRRLGPAYWHFLVAVDTREQHANADQIRGNVDPR